MFAGKGVSVHDIIKPMIYRVVTVFVFLVALGFVIAYARGYRLDIQNTELSSRGLVAVTSSPRSAKIFINDTFKGVTDTSLYLEPNTYTVNIVKDGYFPWSKTIKIQGEIVQSVDATLYPINASLTPLTNIGVLQAIPFGVDGKKVLIFSAQSADKPATNAGSLAPLGETEEVEKEGIFVYDPRTQAVSIFPSLTHIAEYSAFGTDIQPENYDVLFGPSFDQAILFYNPTYGGETSPLISQFDPSYQAPQSFEMAYLINLNELNTSPLDITNSALSLVDAWTQEKRSNIETLLGGYHRKIQDFIGSNTKIVDISPDKTRILYEATGSATLEPVLKRPLIGVNQTVDIRTVEPSTLYVYDVREDRNYALVSESDLSKYHSYPLFHPNSKNIILNEEETIGVMDYDGLNKQKLYSGPYDPGFFAVTSDGRVLVLTNFNSALERAYDLYAVGIR